MDEVEFEKNAYKGMSTPEIRKSTKNDGFDPVVIANSPGYIYSSHTHPETKLLAILEGSMEVTVDAKTFQAEQGDKIIIPGGEKHSAVVGDNGCRFFWSEKLM